MIVAVPVTVGVKVSVGVMLGVMVAVAVSVAVAVAVGVVLWKNERINTSSHEVVAELRKVTWPSRKETQTSTIVVIITTVIVSFILWLFDLLWSWVTGLLYHQ